MKPLIALLLATWVLSACESAPALKAAPRRHEDIGWIDREFRHCVRKDCPLPTRKTLAAIDRPAASKEPTPVAPEAPRVEAEPFVQAEAPTTMIRFRFAQSLPTLEGQQALEHLAKIARAYHHIELQGRTDDLGAKGSNDRLARRRAEYVHAWLVDRGIAAEIVVHAEGLCCYLDSAPTEAARRKNRRVEVRLAGRRDVVSTPPGE